MHKTHGLTLGKFAPLHRGHQLVIETALAENDEVSVIIYDSPEVTDIPLPVRKAWLKQLYPSIRIIEAWDGPAEVGDTPEIKKMHEDYIINTLRVSGITHFYSSEFYGEHVSAALGAVNRVVDPDRKTVPISGMCIREMPFINRRFVHPIVYRDLITNVVFLGAPSTGKTTMSEKMAGVYNTVWMPEYGREYWEAHQVNRRVTLPELDFIAAEHLRREEALLYNADRYLFTDTNALTTSMFSQYYHNCVSDELAGYANNALKRYDLFFLCDTDIPYDDTWDRSGDANRLLFQKQIIADLLVRKIPYILLSGSIERRVNTVKSVLQNFRKYTPLPKLFLQSGD